jgi:aryl-alcohol dehydrogenase-like predicted oxidoreductase/predicted kinase
MTAWLDAKELRVGLGCMRLPSDGDVALATIAAAADAGVTVFDTARAYAGNEQLLARALRGRAVRIVTKGGMARPDGRWVPDGRARTVRSDCEESLRALDGLPIDLYLVHAPDPRTPWRTTVRALAKLVDDGLVRSVGVANVNRRQLDEALELAPLTAVQVAVSVYDDHAIRGGVVARCEERGLTVIAHSPLGGPRRIARLRRDEELVRVASAHAVSPEVIALTRLLDLSPALVAIPGARTADAARSAARAASLELAGARPIARIASRRSGEVVLLMGIPGAGKSVAAERLVAQGYARLNRDERGGTLSDIAAALDERLAESDSRVVLDNTYLTRAQRSPVIETAARHGVAVRCRWFDTPFAQAQVNMVERLLERFGSLPTRDELRRRSRQEPGLHTPTSQMRAARELEEPEEDEGFERVERIVFERAEQAGVAGVFVAAPVLEQHGWEHAVAASAPPSPHLLFDWRPDEPEDALKATASRLAAAVTGPVEHAVCTHPGGPPVCWCRPPLPGLLLAFARRHSIALKRSVLVGSSPAHRTLARTLGARFVET